MVRNSTIDFVSATHEQVTYHTRSKSSDALHYGRRPFPESLIGCANHWAQHWLHHVGKQEKQSPQQVNWFGATLERGPSPDIAADGWRHPEVALELALGSTKVLSRAHITRNPATEQKKVHRVQDLGDSNEHCRFGTVGWLLKQQQQKSNQGTMQLTVADRAFCSFAFCSFFDRAKDPKTYDSCVWVIAHTVWAIGINRSFESFKPKH